MTPTSISVSASTADPAPTALVTVTIGNALIGVEYYVAATTTNSGVASVNVGSEGSSSVQATGGVTINFKPPSSLALGKYTQLGSGAVQWTFTGDDVCSAAVISQYVIAAGCDGKLFGLNAADGTQVWTADPGAPPIWSFGAQAPIQSLAAGEGVLVVPAGTKLVTYTVATAP